MKVRTGFVSNSSSCSFLIINKSDEDLHISELIRENPQILEEWFQEYSALGEDSSEWDNEKFMEDARIHYPDDIIEARSSCTLRYGDEDGTMVGKVFDYILREGGDSERFTWQLQEMLR
jgi:hypothetical protein